MYFLRQLIVL